MAFTLHVTCQGCGRAASVPVDGPHHFAYGDAYRPMRWGLGECLAPEGWPQTINVADRCQSCYDAHLERMRPVWKQQDADRDAAVRAASIDELLDSLVPLWGTSPPYRQIAELKRRLTEGAA